tara:strand:+ start:674 stop:1108 length:435 start_codon:yes stop_codon:yes gene_type:complete
MPKYRIREEYVLDTKVTNKPFLKELISTNCIDYRDIDQYRCDISDNEERYFYHSYDIHTGEQEHTQHNVFTLYELREIARAEQCEGTDEEITQDSHMILGYHGYDEVDQVDEDVYWNSDMTSCAYLSHVQEITKEEYKILGRRL